MKPDGIRDLVAGAYLEYRRRFDELTARAAARFAAREWREGQADGRARILLYRQVLERTVPRVEALAAEETDPAAAGAAWKASYGEWARGRPDMELAETFFNSVMRRALGTVGADPTVEFVGHDLDRPRPPPPPLARYAWDASDPAGVLRRALAELPVPAPFRDPGGCAELAAWRLLADLARLGIPVDEDAVLELELLPVLFYRNKAAYAAGRVTHRRGSLPLVLALSHPPGGVEVDAVLLSADEASVVFGFSRSYFQARLEDPGAVVSYLLTLMPHRRIDELYTAVGHNRHGKTEFYRALYGALDRGSARFQPAPGEPGLVMSVFTLPTLNVVFKVIRDRFGYPKRTNREQVLRKYELIFLRDRVGRLADAQEYHWLKLPREAFATAVLADLGRECGRTVRAAGNHIVLEHLYTERRVRPLDLYLEEADEEAARAAVLDFGQAVKDLAAASIFPGDMLIKNFGVTRHGRVIFYDYDEVQLLGECTFRRIPEAPNPEAELMEEPWFSVGPDDVFPEELARFVGPPGELGRLFRTAHGELFTIEFWREMQRVAAEGEVVDFYPYPEHRRLRANGERINPASALW